VSKLTLERIHTPEAWTKLLSRSPQATRFLDPDLLSIFGADIRFYGLFRNGFCIMGLPIIDPRPIGETALPWCYKLGPILHDELYKSARTKRIQNEVELAEAALTQLAKVEDWFRFSLHEDFNDMRGYDWVHYHEPDKARCTILPRYTAVLPLKGVTSEIIRKTARSARRQEEGYARTREALSTSLDGTIEELFALYCESFARQGIEISANERALFAPYLTYFINAGVGHILTVRDEAGRAVAGAFVFKDYDNVWHVPIVGIGNTRYGGTMLYFQLADFVHQHGGDALDFDGANSPNRAYFKHSLGAEPQLYFEIRYEASSD
jgi:hypothetical protein